MYAKYIMTKKTQMVLRHEILFSDIIEGRMQGEEAEKDWTCSMTSRRQQDTWRSRELQKIGVCGVQ